MLTSFTVLTVLYGVLAAVVVGLFLRYARAVPPSTPADTEPEQPTPAVRSRGTASRW